MILTGIGVLVFRALLLLIAILLPLFLRLLSILFALMIFSIVSFAVGPRISVSRAADLWTDRIIKIGIPPEYWDPVNAIVAFCAWLALVSGWTFTVLISVLILRVVFGIFT